MLGVLRWTLPWVILAASLLSVGASWQVEHAFGDEAFTSSGVLEDGMEASALHIASFMPAMLQETRLLLSLSDVRECQLPQHLVSFRGCSS